MADVLLFLIDLLTGLRISQPRRKAGRSLWRRARKHEVMTWGIGDKYVRLS